MLIVADLVSLSEKIKYAICIVLPSNKHVTMETNFQNIKIDHFQI